MKEDLSTWNGMPSVCKRALVIVKIPILTKSTYKQNQTSEDFKK